MTLKESIKKFWGFLKEDSWQSWIVSIILIIILIKFIIFPALSLVTGTALPLVVVESCSMYHPSDFNSYWTAHGAWYEAHNISKADFESYGFNNGINKGDIILVTGYSKIKEGDIIIFNANSNSIMYPIIHRVVSLNPIETKGDNNNIPGAEQISGIETNIKQNQIIGKSIIRIPYLGWIKLIFFEPFKPANQRGFCK